VVITVCFRELILNMCHKKFPKTTKQNSQEINLMDNVIEFCAKIYKHSDWWSFGVYLIHQKDETYMCIDFYKWSINIGLMYSEEDDWIDEDFECWIRDYWG
jgi:hypothetical protein